MDFQVPHCDQRVLHAPGECQVCDAQPEWQWLRQTWGINFTGHHEKTDERGHPLLPCPSETARPLGRINQWDGNVPYKGGKVNNDAPMFDGKNVLHDSWARKVLLADKDCDICHGKGFIVVSGEHSYDPLTEVLCDCTKQ
jgi:hypothetical protein